MVKFIAFIALLVAVAHGVAAIDLPTDNGATASGFKNVQAQIASIE